MLVNQMLGQKQFPRKVSMKFDGGSTLTAAVALIVTLLCVASRIPVAVAHGHAHGSGDHQALDLAEQMAKTSMNLWNVTGPAKDEFQYELGAFLRGIELVWEETGDDKYIDFIKFKIDRFVNENATITSYNLTDFTLDNILSGRLVLFLYKETGEEKFKKAADLLREQLKQQPRLKEGGFWHKKVYPYQMWLDGLYMAEPFYAEYAEEFDEPEAFDDIALQFIVMEKRSRDSKTGLLYHGYDESRVANWSDPVTGQSPSFWGRGVGWYAMALVDTLDFFPKDHPKRDELIAILQRLVMAVKKVQDSESGLWWQVLDKGGDKGNYLESSASAMFVYSFAKGVRRGYLPEEYLRRAVKGYKGIVTHFVQSAPDGGVNYTQTVGVGGLGGNPWRNGTYAYYIREPIVSDDPKGVGPFMMASVEISCVQ